MIAILENYQQADGSVKVPEVLKPWMGGIDSHQERTMNPFLEGSLDTIVVIGILIGVLGNLHPILPGGDGHLVGDPWLWLDSRIQLGQWRDIRCHHHTAHCGQSDR